METKESSPELLISFQAKVFAFYVQLTHRPVMLERHGGDGFMTSEKSINVEEVTSLSKIKLVVTDSETHSLEELNGAPTASKLAPTSTEGNVRSEIDDPEKVMRELPVDDFFKVLEQATPEQLQALIHTFEKGARTKGGTAILQKVIEVPNEPRTTMSIISWWEWRRPLYNLVLAITGLPSVLVLWLLIGLPLMLCVMSGLCYLFFANICYTLGTPAEMVARTCYKEKAETYGPVLLTLGTIFSVILTIALELVVVGFMCLGAFQFF